jgi:hypothetical protein
MEAEFGRAGAHLNETYMSRLSPRRAAVEVLLQVDLHKEDDFIFAQGGP